ncbi:MAG: hypothetical protein ACE5JI_02115 [Acidobacteriota bacterium]
MKRAAGCWLLAGVVLAPSLVRASGAVTVSYENGLLTVKCTEAPLEQVFESIKASTGLELLLEKSIKKTRLTADIRAEPFNLAIERLLEGSGVNYAMFLDREDWRRVAKIFIGGGGGGPAASNSPVRASQQPSRRTPGRRPPRPPETAEEDFEGASFDSAIALEGAEDAPDPRRPGQGETEPGLSPGFVPAPPSFPRSTATPGLESSPFQTRPNTQGGAGATTPGSNPAPYYPFLDPFGRPIPAPGTTPQQQKQQQKERKPPS